jgi:phage shock protein E
MNSTQSTSIKALVLDLVRQAWNDEQASIAAIPEAGRRDATEMIAHIAAWRQRHAEKLATVVRGETPPVWTDMEVVNRLNAESARETQRLDWSQALDRSRSAYAALVAQIERLSEDELADAHRYPALGGEALWPETLGNGFWHPYTHLLEFARRRSDAARLAQLQDARIAAQERVLATQAARGVPEREQVGDTYNLACLYALAGHPAQAMETLRAALALRPDLALHARQDEDFASLGEDPRFQALVSGAAQPELVGAGELHRRLGNAEEPYVVDVRDPAEFAAGHVRGARNIPLGELDNRLGEIPSDRLVVTYCNMYHRGSSRGERAAALLAARGRTARALDGGYPGWRSAGLPVEE